MFANSPMQYVPGTPQMREFYVESSEAVVPQIKTVNSTNHRTELRDVHISSTLSPLVRLQSRDFIHQRTPVHNVKEVYHKKFPTDVNITTSSLSPQEQVVPGTPKGSDNYRGNIEERSIFKEPRTEVLKRRRSPIKKAPPLINAIDLFGGEEIFA